MTLFDPAFYAATNPDVVAKYGTDPDALLWHYLQRGKKEGRPPIAPPTPTPTPTPWWMYPQEKTEESSEEPEEEPEPTPTAAPTPTPIPNPIGQGSYDSAAVPTAGGGGNIDLKDSNGNTIGTVEAVFNPPNNNILYITPKSSGNYSLPITISDSSGNNGDYTVNDLNSIRWHGATGTPLTITNSNTGNYVQVTAGTPTNTFTLYNSNNNVLHQENNDYDFYNWIDTEKNNGNYY